MIYETNRWTSGLLIVGAAILTACAPYEAVYRPKPIIPPQLPVAPAAMPEPIEMADLDGSLWPHYPQWNLFSDHKALNEGDIIFVEISQRNEGVKDASTETSRESSIIAKITSLFGFEEDINDLTEQEALIEAESKSEFEGEGSTERRDDLRATVSAVVTDVLPNGNLVVYGHQVVQINDEASVLTLQGIVRPADVTADNRVQAERIANAHIEFSGAGVVTEHQRVGWGQRLFAYLWPF